MSTAAGGRSIRLPFTREQLDAATHVRTVLGWYRVIQVQRVTVTVASGASPTDSVLVDKILEVRP